MRKPQGIDADTSRGAFDALLHLLHSADRPGLERAVLQLERKLQDFEGAAGSIDETEPVVQTLCSRLAEWSRGFSAQIRTYGEIRIDSVEAFSRELVHIGEIIRTSTTAAECLKRLHWEFATPIGHESSDVDAGMILSRFDRERSDAVRTRLMGPPSFASRAVRAPATLGVFLGGLGILATSAASAWIAGQRWNAVELLTMAWGLLSITLLTAVLVFAGYTLNHRYSWTWRLAERIYEQSTAAIRLYLRTPS